MENIKEKQLNFPRVIMVKQYVGSHNPFSSEDEKKEVNEKLNSLSSDVLGVDGCCKDGLVQHSREQIKKLFYLIISWIPFLTVGIFFVILKVK